MRTRNYNPRVVVIGRNYTSRLGMIRAVGMLGYDVYVIRTNGKPSKSDIDSCSRYVKKYLFSPEPNRKDLIKTLLSIAQKRDCKDIIIPVDDYAASTIDENIEILKDSYLFPNIDMKAGAITHVMDKELQKKLVKEVGLNVADGWKIDVKNGNYTIPANIQYPCFPKPEISFLGNKRCMRRCNNEQELREAISVVTERYPNCPFLVEKYIEIEKEFATLGFCDGQNVVLPAIIQLLVDGSGPHKGVTLQGKVLPPDNFKSFYEKVSRLMVNMHFVGLFDVDSYESKGQIYFNELNCRFGASGFSITKSGVNLPNMLIDHLLGKEINANQKVKESKSFVNEKVAIEDYYGKFITKSEYKKYIKKSDFTFIKDEEDPAPYHAFLRKHSFFHLLWVRIFSYCSRKYKNIKHYIHNQIDKSFCL